MLMMGLIGMGNNPMVGATVAVAVAVEEATVNRNYLKITSLVITKEVLNIKANQT